ncbi:hypothetical protein NAP1_06715 [Erythrobacter sp. NAP1]|uniref:glycine-rich domain-containing protein n=1 Tax=Erythrobacter sp. NAP1 TaxID=237727 RepID=UPI0000686F34|nr:hypothetical protein [Erythrobacter sp. NAP1]EAQ30449.1 hypothetical protein NAP1_06715 [Erythrobacter sp. NAP1]
MSASDPSIEYATSTELWKRLDSYVIGPETATLSFPARLARENRWEADFTSRVICEYKRFCYLAVTAGQEVTPSDAVDQAWHLHLTYSRDYWGEYCEEILQCDLHHGPTAGGAAEKSRFYDQYAETLELYEDAFGETAPPDIWPAAQRRFGRDPKGIRVNPDDVMVLERRVAILGAFGWIALGVGIAVVVGVIF